MKPREKNDGRGRLGGRAKGVPNKITATMRELLTKFSADTYDDFVDAFHKIDNPKDKCTVWLNAQAFVTPKLSSVDVKETGKTKTFKDELDEIDKDS